MVAARTGGLVIRFSADDVRPAGRASYGVAGQQVPSDGRCVALTGILAGAPEAQGVTLDRAGSGKRSPLDDYPVQRRGGKGVLSGAQDLAWCGVAADLHVVTVDGPDVVRPVQFDVTSRSGRPVSVLPPLVGPVVAERY